MVKHLPDSALAGVQTYIDVTQPRAFQVVPSRRKAYYRFSLHLPPTQAAPPLIADALDEFLGFVYHEQFHFLVQPEWPRSPDALNQDIYQDYPIDPLPRAYRSALAQSLRTALLSREPAERQVALGQAAGLFTGWRTQSVPLSSNWRALPGDPVGQRKKCPPRQLFLAAFFARGQNALRGFGNTRKNR